MANAFYTGYLNKIQKGDIDLDTMVVLIDLVDTNDYSFSAAHTARTSVNTGGAVVDTSAELTPTLTGAAVDVPDFAFTASSGDQSEALVVYVGASAAADSAWFPVIYVDTASSGLPISPNGEDINVTINGSGLWSL